MNESLAQHYLDDAIFSFRTYKKLAEKALDQLKDEEYFVTLDPESNSIAVMMKHMAGNMFSRWTDFLTSDGEKPDRNRDMEFVIGAETTKDNVRDYWERGWACLFDALEPLQPADFERKVLIRGEPHTIVQAINRQLSHYAQHIGQIVFLAKHFRSAQWQSLSIPRNQSAAFNDYLAAKPPVERNTEERFEEVERFGKGSAVKEE
ncbi:MAG: DUF1572 family protein [Pyrinomonadaceae bacterium]